MQKVMILVLIIVIISAIPLVHLSANAKDYSIPAWIHHNAKWWADDQIGDNDYVQGLQYLFNQNIIVIPQTQSGVSTGTVSIPAWIKSDAGGWASGQVSDDEYVKSLQYLISNGIMKIGSQSKTYSAQPSSNGGLIISIFGTNPAPLVPIVKKHNLGANDFVASFKDTTLTQYENMNMVLIAASLDGIKHAIQVVQSNPSYGINYIAYDNEHSNSPPTPASEQQDPTGSTNQAATLVHAAGLKFGIAPDGGFLMSEYQGVDWSKIDMVVIQIQRALTKNPDLAQSTVSSVAPFAKSHNPNVKVLIQVNPSLADQSTITSFINTNRNVMDGVSIICCGTSDASLLDSTLTALGR